MGFKGLVLDGPGWGNAPGTCMYVSPGPLSLPFLALASTNLNIFDLSECVPAEDLVGQSQGELYVCVCEEVPC